MFLLLTVTLQVFAKIRKQGRKIIKVDSIIAKV